MRYRPEIDGLRAIAVLPVILFHAGFEVFSGGFVGVDIFFVISGFLITSILIEELERGDFSVLRFYERRARRILPALFVVMAACLPFAYLWMLPAQLEDFAQSLVAVVFSVSNVLFWREDGYFAAAAELKPLLHTWSLGVEEQYYLLFPAFLLMFWRIGRSRVLFIVMAMALLSLGAAELGWRYKPSAAFYLAPTRAWELFAGSICGFLTVGRGPQSSNAASLAGVALIGFSIFSYDSTTPFPGLYALAPVVGTVLVIVFAAPATVVARVLSKPPFVGVGLISYSAYLWHQPLFAFARLRSLAEPGPVLMATLACVALALAWVTWYFVEQAFRKRPVPLLATRRTLFVTSGAVGAAFVLAGAAVLTFKDDLRADWLARHPESAQIFNLLEKAKQQGNWIQDIEQEGLETNCRFNASTLDGKISARLLACAQDHGRGILILGDSHAVDLYGMVASRFPDPFIAGLTQEGCRPHSADAQCHYDTILQFVSQNPHVFRQIIYTQAGFYLLMDLQGREISRRILSAPLLTDPIEPLTINAAHVDATLAYLEKLAAFVDVTWFGPRTEPHVPENTLLALGCDATFALRPGQEALFLTLDHYIRDRIATGRQIRYVSQIDTLNYHWPYDLGSCADLYFSDGDHYSAAGELRFGARLPDDFLSAR